MASVRVYIFRDSEIGDCTNNGVTSPDMAAGRSFFVCSSLSDADKLPAPPNSLKPIALILQSKMIAGKEYKYLVPEHIMYANYHSMMGGNFAYSCDSRFREISDYPLPVHDRVE